MVQKVEDQMNNLVEEINFPRATSLFSTLSGGKRLRAKLVLKIATEHKDAPLLGAVIELIHAASLLHDDVIDDAELRRGVASVNATEDSKTAIMLGDILYSKAFTTLTKFDAKVAHRVASAVTALSVGEMQDVEMGKSFNSDESLYIEMINNKTASLIEASCASAALLMNKDETSYATYGKNLGLAFQIIDDILDIVSDEKTLGKPALNDFVEGKCTLPYIYLYHDLEGDEREKLISFHAQKLSAKDAGWIKEKMQKFNCVERSYILARQLSDEALQSIEGDSALSAIIDTMMQREF